MCCGLVVCKLCKPAVKGNAHATIPRRQSSDNIMNLHDHRQILSNRDVSAFHSNAPVLSPVLSVSPPPCKDERFPVGMEEWTDSASKSPPSRSPTRPVTRKRQRYSKGEQVWEEPLPRGLR